MKPHADAGPPPEVSLYDIPRFRLRQARKKAITLALAAREKGHIGAARRWEQIALDCTAELRRTRRRAA